ncbi:helix-turn-helix transcriptional regulator [Diaphorobacter sp. HDW4A]|uniref:helix-turn-helix domain-containing protein n=1 Tax=Diaphorobacter sp. HDW4A TaxID=2714924 RepID=UPI00140D9409|nr:XRE family transcriptional regulator [Diaphorobacter sp. HDW4A]QIL81198.1 helix-turn-helix transcriptional regulator [Diaphorobacter sp. HDW4A]
MPSHEISSPAEPDVQFGLAVRSRRSQLGITLDQLAEASGVSPGALSRVERGLLGASLRNALAIARGLGCELGELIQSEGEVQITRKGEYRRYVHEESGVERLALAHPSPGLELVQYRLPPGAESSHFAAHRAGTREVFHILEGDVRVWIGQESVLLNAGDTAVLDMDTEHRFANEGRKTARLMLLVIAPMK